MARPATHHEARRRALVAAAEPVFVEKGYRATTVADLLAATGTSRGGFYHYFASKDEVLRAALDGILDEAVDVLTSAAELDLPPTERLAAVFRGMRGLRARHGEFARLLAVVVADQSPAAAFHDDVIRRLGPPLASVLTGFPVGHPRQTAELVLDAITAITRSPQRDEYLRDPQALHELTRATRELIGGALGIGPDHPCLDEFGW